MEAAEKYNPIDPDHYKTEGIEVWEMMLKIWGEEAFKNYCQLNAFKYRMRAGKKPGQPAEQDLKKAAWYEEKLKEFKQKPWPGMLAIVQQHEAERDAASSIFMDPIEWLMYNNFNSYNGNFIHNVDNKILTHRQVCIKYMAYVKAAKKRYQDYTVNAQLCALQNDAIKVLKLFAENYIFINGFAQETITKKILSPQETWQIIRTQIGC